MGLPYAVQTMVDGLLAGVVELSRRQEGFEYVLSFQRTEYQDRPWLVLLFKLGPHVVLTHDRLRVREHTSGNLNRLYVTYHIRDPCLEPPGIDYPYATYFFRSKDDGAETRRRKDMCPEKRPMANIEGGERQNKAAGAERKAVVAFSPTDICARNCDTSNAVSHGCSGFVSG